jgi:diguanylate cyclase (GGDEF)-like protein/PAS domain S-box-containing protein
VPLVVSVAKSEEAVLRNFQVVRGTHYAVAAVLTLVLALVGLLAARVLRAHQSAAGAQLENSEKRYRLALDTSRLAMWEWDVASDNFYASELWQTMLGGPAQALSIKSAALRERVHPDDAERERACVIQVLKGHVPRLDMEYRLRTQSGGWLWCHCSGEVLERDAAGRAVRLVGTQSDISARKLSEEALRVSEERFRGAFDQASVGITVMSPESRFLQVNDKYCDISGYRREELLGMSVAAVNRPRDVEIANDQRRQLLAREINVAYREKQIVRKDGSLVWISVATSVVRSNDGSPQDFISVVQDVSEIKAAVAALRESEERFRQFAHNIPLMLWMADPMDGSTIYVSPAGQKMLGADVTRRPRKVVGAVHPDDRRRIRIARKLAGDGHYDEIFRIKRADGALRWVHDRAYPVHDERGALVRIVGIAEDITEQRLAEERIAYASSYDALTGLPNRVQFHQRLTQAMAGEDRQGVVVLLIDADHFKKINDTLGHANGDELLKQLAQRLQNTARPDDLVARMGGDEFAVLLRGISEATYAEHVAASISEAMQRPCQFGGEEVHLGISIGIAMAGRDGGDADTLLRNADAAMYGAKNAGRNTYRFYESEMTRRAMELLRLENNLRRALERREFSLLYQPKARVVDGQVTGFEVLLRWNHPVRGTVSPVEFIPVLEETGLIVPVGEWVIREVCAQLRTWDKHGMSNYPVAINVSARQFSDPGFAARVKRILDEEMIDPRMIELEITESMLMTGAEQAISTLQVLKLLGISISIDDFGTGYSSLSYLKRFPLDALKIDRSFVRDIPEDLDDAAITRTIISMAHGLRLKVIAEGVERPEQLHFLAEHGCDFIQGYLLSEPRPAQEWTEKYGRDPLSVSQKTYLRLATGSLPADA